MFFRKKKNVPKKVGKVTPIPIAEWGPVPYNDDQESGEASSIQERNQDLARQIKALN